MNDIGFVVIGRNEGQRLVRCLASLVGEGRHCVYVDSGSTDDSVAQAHRLGAEVVELDCSTPFTAGRARNQGVQHLLAHHPAIAFIQFVDGDCEVVPGWLDVGLAVLTAQPETAVVCGRCRERFPDASVYNRLCDLEWAAPAGNADACGGIALFRRSAFEAAGGFRESLIAGEEPELCLRLRAAGWKVWRADSDMVWHDAAMHSFRQWWRRARRGGHAYAECGRLHAIGPLTLWQRERRGIVLWAVVLPLLILTAVAAVGPWALAGLLAYGLLVLKIWRGNVRRFGSRHAALYALFCVVAKFPQVLGMAACYWNRWRRRPSRIIEYKGPEVEALS